MVAIVGREAELDAVGRFLDGVPAGLAALVIEGEVGIGKTTVWLEAVSAAEARSYRVLRARPAEREAMLSYTALADLIGDAFDETRAMLPAPQERALAACLLRAEADEPVTTRTTATALISILVALASERPVLVALDDVQWLDPASGRVLEFAARRLPHQVGLVVTSRAERDGDPPLGLRCAFPEDRLSRIVLRPLSLAALYHLIRNRLGASLGRPKLTRLAAASGGNPLFALEIARATDGDERLLGDPLPVPRSLRELMAARVRAISPGAQQAVLVAAALSRPTVATVAEALAAESETPAPLAEAEEAGVLVSDRGYIRFVHPLLSSVVYGSASSARRRHLHRRLAEVVPDPEERARHLAQSTTEADETIAAEIEHTARQAALRGAQDAAAELFEAAGWLTPGDRLEGLVSRTLGEASALLAVGDLAGARSLAERVVEVSPTPSLQAQGLIILGEIAWLNGEARAATEHLEQALATAKNDQELMGRTYAKLVVFTVPLDPQRAVEHADAALRVLSEEREPGLLAHVLINLFYAEAVLGRGSRRELLERGLELEARAGPAVAKSTIPLIWFHCTDDFDAARARHASEDQWYRERGEEGWRAERLAHLGLAELRAGQWELAEQYVEQSCAELEQFSGSGPWAMPFYMRSLVDAHRGRTERARTTLMPLIEKAAQGYQPFWTALLLSTLGFVEWAAGQHEAADRALTQMRERLDTIGVVDFPGDRSEPFHIETLLALGERERARDLLRGLEERGRTLPRIWIAATLPRARALVLAADGDVDGALESLEELDAAASQLPFELGLTLLVQGQLHRRTKQKRAAADTLRKALDIFERLGAPKWAELARDELARVGLRRSSDQLTATELRVAELAALGLTNREVANAAFLSPKTVEANLTRVYRKLDIHSRAELGAQMAARRRTFETQT